MKSISEETQSTTLAKEDLILISKWDGVSAYNSRYVTADLCDSVDKKVFIARIQQTGTSAPTITIIKDDFNDTYTPVYVIAGRYRIDGFNNELDADIEVYVNSNRMALGNYIQARYLDADSIQIDTANNSVVLADNLILAGTYLKVIKYI